MRYIPTYLIYTAILVRALTWYASEGREFDWLVLGLLVIYGLLLVSEPRLTRRLPCYPRLYLLVQSGLALSALSLEPGMDFQAMLFAPLSFQVVLFFGRRVGFAWIAAFALASAPPLLGGMDTPLNGVIMTLVFCGIDAIVGSYAVLTQRAEAGWQNNQRLLGEVQAAYRQLQEYAAQAEEFAAAQERSRMARELHDSVTQTIFSMNLSVQAARMLVERQPEQAAGQLDRLQELARSAVGEMQVLVSQLRPRSAAQEGLPAALRRLASERQERDGLKIQLELLGERELPEAATLGLYRIAQEALTNVAKHAGAQQANLRLDLQSTPACLEIEDSGCGFEAGKLARSSEHIGLPGMAERAREFGWRLAIDSQPGRGTRVRVEEG